MHFSVTVRDPCRHAYTFPLVPAKRFLPFDCLPKCCIAICVQSIFFFEIITAYPHCSNWPAPDSVDHTGQEGGAPASSSSLSSPSDAAAAAAAAMYISCGDDGAGGESEMGYVPNNPLFGMPLDSPQVHCAGDARTAFRIGAPVRWQFFGQYGRHRFAPCVFLGASYPSIYPKHCPHRTDRTTPN